VQHNAPLHVLVTGHLPGWVRAAQLIACALVGYLVTRRSGVAAGLTAGLAVRILLEPGDFDYYFGSLAIAATGRRQSFLVLAAWATKMVPFQPWPRLILLLLIVLAKPEPVAGDQSAGRAVTEDADADLVRRHERAQVVA
jgi:hypothetical protein